jgi:nicotinamidase-related amidase
MANPSPDSVEFFQARGFGIKIGFGQRPALMVIDLANAFTDPQMPLGANLDAVVAEVQRLLEAARLASIPIFYTTVGYEEGFADAGVWFLKQKGTTSLRLGTPAVEIDDRVKPEPSEPVILKKYASSFFGTDLASRLTSQGIDTLLIAGGTTSGCVRATAVDAVQLGYRPMVIREAVGDRSPAAHDQALFDLEQKYADVVSVDETISYLSALSGSNRERIS